MEQGEQQLPHVSVRSCGGKGGLGPGAWLGREAQQRMGHEGEVTCTDPGAHPCLSPESSPPHCTRIKDSPLALLAAPSTSRALQSCVRTDMKPLNITQPQVSVAMRIIEDRGCQKVSRPGFDPGTSGL